VVPLAIPRLPLPAILAALVLDAVDQTLFQSFTDLDLTGYQTYDKALDVYYLAIAYLATMRNWTNLGAFRVGRFLLYYRLVGVVLFEITQTRELLLVFPNTFEYFFIFYELVRLRWDPTRLTPRTVLQVAAAIWIVIKLPQEYWIHVAGLDVTDILGDNPAIAPVIAVATVLLLAFAWWVVALRMPPTDHEPVLAIDVHDLVPPARRPAGLTRSLRELLDRSVVEKIALVSLMSIIFAQILPAVDASPLEITLAVGSLIVVNTAVSERMSRRGVGWETALRQFIAMAAVNLAIVVAARLLIPRNIGVILFDNTLFFQLLLTLLVTLFDRFRPYHLARLARSATLSVQPTQPTPRAPGSPA